MRDYVKIYLDKKFPHKIDIERKKHYKFPNVFLELFKCGEKRLFVRIYGGEQSIYHYFDVHPEDLQIWFGMSYDSAERKLLDWVADRIKKQESAGIYDV